MSRSALYILTTVLLASACNKAVMEYSNMGSIALSLASDVEVVVTTKADTDVDYDSFLINVAGQTFIGNQYSEDYIYGQMTGDIDIPYGTYVVSAQSCTAEVAESSNGGFGCVRYAGASSEVSIMSTVPEQVNVTCPMVNAKATLTFDESFLEDFENPSAELILGERTVTLQNAEDALSKAAYFNVSADSRLTYIVYGTIGGKRLSYTGKMDIGQAKWAKIVIRSNHNGQIGPDIWVDENMGENSFTEILDPSAGDEIISGDLNLPSVIVNTVIDDAVIVDCMIDIF